MTRAIMAFLVITFATCASAADVAEPLPMDQRAVNWLIAQQDAKGLWNAPAASNLESAFVTAAAVAGLSNLPTATGQSQREKGIDAILALQMEDGRYAKSNTIHAFVTCCLNRYLQSVNYKLPDSRTQALIAAQRKAMTVLFKLQDPDAGSWKSDDALFSDTALTCLNLQSLAAAKIARVMEHDAPSHTLFQQSLTSAADWIQKRNVRDERELAALSTAEMLEEAERSNARGLLSNSAEAQYFIADELTQRVKAGAIDGWLLCEIADGGGSHGWNKALRWLELNSAFNKLQRADGAIISTGRMANAGGPALSTALMLWAMRRRQGTCTGW